MSELSEALREIWRQEREEQERRAIAFVDWVTAKIKPRTPYEPMKALEEWHKATGEAPFIERDEEGRKKLLALRRDLLLEEVKEVVYEIELFLKGDPSASIARLMAELGDVLYITYGTAEVLERDLPAVFDAIHRKNMEKVDPETGTVKRREDGKILKPDNFKPLTEEDIEAIIN